MLVSAGPEVVTDSVDSLQRHIPKLIFRTSTERYENLNEKLYKIFEKTAENNAGYSQVYFDVNEREHFIKKFYPVYWPYYDGVLPEQYRMDFFRYLLTYRYGGIVV